MTSERPRGGDLSITVDLRRQQPRPGGWLHGGDKCINLRYFGDGNEVLDVGSEGRETEELQGEPTGFWLEPWWAMMPFPGMAKAS